MADVLEYSCEVCKADPDLPVDHHYENQAGWLVSICDDCVAALMPQFVARMLDKCGYELVVVSY